MKPYTNIYIGVSFERLGQNFAYKERRDVMKNANKKIKGKLSELLETEKKINTHGENF